LQIAATSGWTSADVELFPLRSEHVTQRYVDWLNDPEVNRFLESRFQHHTLESTQGFVRACEMNPEQLFAGIRYRPLAVVTSAISSWTSIASTGSPRLAF
jgi:hypothetical protein